MSLTKIQQSQMSGSLAFDADLVLNGADYLQKSDRTLVDDLNALRTQIKNIQGTSDWTDLLEGTQDLADIRAAMHVSGTYADFQGELKVTNDALVSGSLEVAGFVEFLDNLKIGGDLQIMGDDLSGSLGGNMRFEAAGKVIVTGDLKVDGNHIVASDNTTAITLSGADVEVAGVLKVSGDEIQDSLGHAMVTFDAAGGIAEVDADLGVTGELSVDTGVINLTDGVVINSSLTAGQLDLDAVRVKMSGDLQVMGDYISGSNGLNLTLQSAGDVKVAGALTVGANEIKSWDGSAATVAITLSGDDVTVEGEMTVDGGKITLTHGSTIDSLEEGVLLLTEDLVEVSGDLQVSGDVIKSSTGDTALTLSGIDVSVSGTLTVDGNTVKSSTNDTVMTFSGANVSMPGDLTVVGNIVVQGAMTTLDTVNLEVRDAIVGFGYVSGSTTELSDSVGDRGFVFSRFGQDNVSIHWSESNDEFRFVLTEDDPNVFNISGSAWVNIHAGNVVSEGNITVEGGQIYGSDVLNLSLAANGDVSVAGDLEVAGDHISGSIGLNISLLSGGDVEVAGDLKVMGNDLSGSFGTGNMRFEAAGKVVVAGDLKVDGDHIVASDNTTAITLSGADVEVAGELTVSGDSISSSIAQVMSFTGSAVTMPGNLTVEGDFVVNGTMMTVNTEHLEVKDTIVGLGYASGSAAVSPAGDRGFIFSRDTDDAVATFWDEESLKFKMVFTNSAPGTGSISEVSYADFHAGVIYSQAGFSGSLTKLVGGGDYMIAGVGITLSTGSNGAITISGASNSYAKDYFGNGDLTGAGNNEIDFSGLGTLSTAEDKNIDVYLNGALLAYGAGRDVTAFTTSTVTLNTTLAESLTGDDVITIVLRSLA